MADLNLGHLISKFVNYKALNINRNTSANKPAQAAFSPVPQQAAQINSANTMPPSPNPREERPVPSRI